MLHNMNVIRLTLQTLCLSVNLHSVSNHMGIILNDNRDFYHNLGAACSNEGSKFMKPDDNNSILRSPLNKDYQCVLQQH